MYYTCILLSLLISNLYAQKSWNEICKGSILNVESTESDIIWYPDSSINGIEVPFYSPMMPCSVLITPDIGVVMEIFLKGTNLYNLNVTEVYDNQKHMRLGIADVNILSAELTPFARPVEIDFNENVMNGSFAIRILGKPIDFNNIVNLGTDYATFEAFSYTNDVSITYSTPATSQSNVVVFLSYYDQKTLGFPYNYLMFFQQKEYVNDFYGVWNVSKNEYGVSPYLTLSNSITFYYDYSAITKFNGQAVIYAPSMGWSKYVSSSWDDSNLHLGEGKTIGVVQRRTDLTKYGTLTNIVFTQPDGVFTIYKGVVEAQGPFYQGFPVQSIKASDYKPGCPPIVLPGNVYSFIIQNGGVSYNLGTTDAPPPPSTTASTSTFTSSKIPITTSHSFSSRFHFAIFFASFRLAMC